MPTISLSQPLLLLILLLHLHQPLLPPFLLICLFLPSQLILLPGSTIFIRASDFTPKETDIARKLALTYPHTHHPPPSPPTTEAVAWGFRQAKPRDPAAGSQLSSTNWVSRVSEYSMITYVVNIANGHDSDVSYLQWTEFRLIPATFQFQLLSLNDSLCEISHLMSYL